MLDEIISQIVRIIWSYILTAMLHPIGAIGQTLRAGIEGGLGGYDPGQVDNVRRKALRGALVLLILWAASYWLLQLWGLLFVGGLTLLIVTLGWFNRFFVVEVD
ncbi:MAG: hypothetical protein M3014_10835 [Chloroflexota bacterium]|nr:hypothetical protein [Chloroflexota bacterium]